MNFIDINKENERVILLIYPMSFTEMGVRDLFINNMSGDYRYIVPELSGHGKSKEIFKSAQREADKIQSYLLDNKVEKIDLAFGASLGGIVLLNLLKNKSLQIKKCIFEGSSLCQSGKLTEFLFRKVALNTYKRALKDREFAIKELTKEYGEELSQLIVDCFINMSQESIKNIASDCAFVKLPNLSKEVQERCIFCYGSKEYFLKDARKIIKRKFPYATLKVWEGFNHCNKIIKDNLEYCKFLESQI